jgi:uncharacterized membrane protein YgaE (UPF0421/DUF939 family)
VNPHGLRAALVIGLAAALSGAIAGGLGLGGQSTTFAVVIAAVVVRPDFGRWPLALYPVLIVLMGLCLGFGTLTAQLLVGTPDVVLFALVTVLLRIAGLLLPGKLQMLANIVPLGGVLPLLSSDPSWQAWGQELATIALGLAVGTLVQINLAPASRSPAPSAAPAPAKATEDATEAPLAQRLRAGLRSPLFWRKTVLLTLALPIGQGLGALTPKYLYFGVLLLLNDTTEATAERVRDRIIGVSLGVLMPLLVFNTFGLSTVSTGLVMGGTATLMTVLRLDRHLCTALISSAIAFSGYGPLVAWYIPNRWLDYLMGSLLAMAAAWWLPPNATSCCEAPRQGPPPA